MKNTIKHLIVSVALLSLAMSSATQATPGSRGASAHFYMRNVLAFIHTSVYVDNQKVGTLHRGQKITVNVTPGYHDFAVRSGPLLPKSHFKTRVQSGQQVYLRVNRGLAVDERGYNIKPVQAGVALRELRQPRVLMPDYHR